MPTIDLTTEELSEMEYHVKREMIERLEFIQSDRSRGNEPHNWAVREYGKLAELLRKVLNANTTEVYKSVHEMPIFEGDLVHVDTADSTVEALEQIHA